MNAKFLFETARTAAVDAVKTPVDGYPCGFAWVNIKPARGDFVKFLKENKIGRKDDYYGGYTISSYDVSGWNGQNMNVKEEQCYAFAAVLQKNGINAYVQSRID